MLNEIAAEATTTQVEADNGERIPVLAANGQVLEPTSIKSAIRRVRQGKGVWCLHDDAPGLRLNHVPEPSLPNPPRAEVKPTTTKSAKRRRRRIAALRRRDGDACFFCHAQMDREEMTIEHLLAAEVYPGFHLSNLVLAHARCNEAAGHLSVMEKVQVREASLPPDCGPDGPGQPRSMPTRSAC